MSIYAAREGGEPLRVLDLKPGPEASYVAAAAPGFGVEAEASSPYPLNPRCTRVQPHVPRIQSSGPTEREYRESIAVLEFDRHKAKGSRLAVAAGCLVTIYALPAELAPARGDTSPRTPRVVADYAPDGGPKVQDVFEEARLAHPSVVRSVAWDKDYDKLATEADDGLRVFTGMSCEAAEELPLAVAYEEMLGAAWDPRGGRKE